MKVKKCFRQLLTHVTQNFIEENKQLGYTTKEEFVRDAIRFRLTWLTGGNECLDSPRRIREAK